MSSVNTEFLNSSPKTQERTTWHNFSKSETFAKDCMVKTGKNGEKRRKILSIFEWENGEKIETNLRDDPGSKKSFSNVKQKLSSTISVLPLDVWENILCHLSPNDVISLSSTCKHTQKMMQTLLKKIDLSFNYSLNLNCLLNYTLCTTCTTINLNHCYWLKASEILQIISKTNLEHLHIIECNVNNECIEAICDLELTSLSISYATDWRLFFRLRKANEAIRGFRELKSLEIFYKQFPSEILIEIYTKVLVHCNELEHFKLFQCPSRAISPAPKSEIDHQYPLSFPKSTLVPKLKSLVINLKSTWSGLIVANVLHSILEDKEIPLEHADFVHQSGFLYNTNKLPDPRIQLNKSKLSLSGLYKDFNFWLNFPSFRELISQPDYKTVEILDVAPDGFGEFAQKIASNSRKTLKEIRIKHRHMFFGERCYLAFLDGLSHIAIKCSQITLIDISGHEFPTYRHFPYISNDMVRRHKTLLNALTHLKNLEKLVIAPTILHCKYYKSNGEKINKALPFWKVTSSCKNLIEIRLTYSHDFTNSLKHWLHEDSLYCIASCAKLKALHLVNFHVEKSAPFALSRITQSCDQLRELYIRDIGRLTDFSYIFSKSIRIISTSAFINCDKNFLNDLSQCHNLEKLYLDDMRIAVSDFDLFGNVLRKLKNLTAFVVRDNLVLAPEQSRNEKLDGILKSIAEEKPAFFYSLNGLNSYYLMPSAHLDSFYHYGIDDHCLGNAL